MIYKTVAIQHNFNKEITVKFFAIKMFAWNSQLKKYNSNSMHSYNRKT